MESTTADEVLDEVLFPSDPLRRRKDFCLDRLVGIARLEARTAAEKVRVLAELVEVCAALDPPGLSPQEADVLCSACGDLKISEIVDAPNWIVS